MPASAAVLTYQAQKQRQRPVHGHHGRVIDRAEGLAQLVHGQSGCLVDHDMGRGAQAVLRGRLDLDTDQRGIN